MEEMEAAINAATSPAVKIWMNWMLAIFAASLYSSSPNHHNSSEYPILLSGYPWQYF